MTSTVTRRRRFLILTGLLALTLLAAELGLRLGRPEGLEAALAAHRGRLERDRTPRDLDPRFASRPRTVIHCLGDSATRREGAAGEKSYPEELQDLLGDVFLVLNLGETGFGIRDAAARSARIGADFPPEVLLLLPGCDDPAADRHSLRREQAGAIRRAWSRSAAWLAQNVRLALLPRWLAGAPAPRGLPPGPAQPEPELLAALDALHADCQTNGRRLLVILRAEIGQSPALAAFCQTKGIPALAVSAPGEARLLAQRVHLALMTGEDVAGPWIPLP